MTIATALCDHCDFERHLKPIACHLAAQMHRSLNPAHRTMVIETTVVAYEPETEDPVAQFYNPKLTGTVP